MTQYNVGFDPTQPTQLVFAAAVKPGGRQIAEQTIYNRDPTVPLLIATEEAHQQPDFTGPRVSTVDPLSSTVVNGTVDVWGVGNPFGPPPIGPQPPPVQGAQASIVVDVIPTALGTSGNPLAIAASIVQSGLSLAIARQIATSGISLVPSPELIYQLGLSSSGNAGLVGETVPNQALQAGCYAAGQSQNAADTNFVQAVSRPSGSQHPAVTKKFWNLSDWSQTKNNLSGPTGYAALGTKVVFCFKPVVTSGLALGSDFTTSGTTAQKNAAAADKASLASFLTFLAGLGFTAATGQIVLWQEPGNNQNLGAAGEVQGPIDYNNMLRTYGPTVNAAHGGVTFPLVANVNYTGKITNATNYANAALGLRAYGGAGAAGLPALSGIAMDFYTNSYFGGNFLGSTDANGDSILSIADSVPLPFGLNEWGCDPGTGKGQFSQAQCNQYMTDDPVNSILAVMSGRIAAGKSNLDCIYYNGQCDATGAGDLTSPILFSSDFRVAGYQRIFDALTVSQVTGTTIGATSTKTVAPLNPSPVGNFAQSDFLSYEIVLGLSAGAASTNPFATVILSFYDFDVTGTAQVVTDVVKHTVPMGTSGDANGPAVVIGHGPLRGAFMTLKITNLDSVACTLQYVQLAGAGRPEDRHVWTYDCNAASSPVIPGFTLAQAASASLQIGRVTGQNINAAATKSWLNGLYAGQAFLRIYAQGAAGDNVNFTLQPQPTSLFGTENLINENVGAAGHQEALFTIALPRAPCLMTVKNNDAGAVTVDYQLIAIET